MAMWNRCAICGRAIPVGELCYGVKNWRGDPIGGDTICRDCLVPENAPTLTPLNEWISVEDGLPTLPDYDYCSVMVNTAYKDNPKSRPMIYERAIVRGKRVERWKYYWDRIADEPPDYWMPVPAPPDRQKKGEK